MRTKTVPNGSADKHTREIKRKKFSMEEKIRIVLDGLRGESSIFELCRREGIAESLCYNWSKEFMEAGKKRLAGDTALTTLHRWFDGGQKAEFLRGVPDATLKHSMSRCRLWNAFGPVSRCGVTGRVEVRIRRVVTCGIGWV
jgi:transposase